jgi:hypothetical protein
MARSERERETERNKVINGEIVTVLNRIKCNAIKTYGEAYVKLHAFCTSTFEESKRSATSLRRFVSPRSMGLKIDWASKAVWALRIRKMCARVESTGNIL